MSPGKVEQTIQYVKEVTNYYNISRFLNLAWWKYDLERFAVTAWYDHLYIMSWCSSEKNRRFKLDVSISML